MLGPLHERVVDAAAHQQSEPSGLPPASTLRRSTARRACAARAFEATFFEEDLVIRAVGDTLVLAPALIAGESEIGAITEKLRRIMAALR